MKLEDITDFTRPVDFRTHQGESLPPQLIQEESVRRLFDILPPVPHILVGAVGNLLVKGVDPLEKSHLPKRGDLDLMVPAMVLPSGDWQEFNDSVRQYQNTAEANTITYWDGGQIVILPDSTVCFLGPEYANLSPTEAQQRFASTYSNQVTVPDNSRLHSVDTGESIIFVGQDIARHNNPKGGDFNGLYADVYPLILTPGEDEAHALYKRGFLPQSGAVRILPDRHMFVLPVDIKAREMPKLDTSYLSQSPQHAIQFLRRLTKNTISMFKHRGFSDPLPAVIKYYDHAYQVAVGVFMGNGMPPGDHESLKSLNRKIKKLAKVIARENRLRAIFSTRPQITYQPQPVGLTN